MVGFRGGTSVVENASLLAVQATGAQIGGGVPVQSQWPQVDVSDLPMSLQAIVCVCVCGH